MPKRILIIDDEEIITRSLTKLLEKNKFEVLVAKGSQDALILIEEVDFDLIISDILMPGMNGVELMKEIQKTLVQLGKKEPPLIFATGFADREIESMAKSLKPFAYLEKPFDIAALVGKVKDLLR